MKQFHEEVAKDGRCSMVVVNCDRREQEFRDSLKSHPWALTLGHKQEEAPLEFLERSCNASVVPKLSIFAHSKGFTRPVVDDVKQQVLKLGKGDITSAEAMTEVMTKITDGIENYDRVAPSEKGD